MYSYLYKMKKDVSLDTCTEGVIPLKPIIGESGAKWHPGRIGTPRVSAHVAVANLWPTRIPRTFGSRTHLGLKIIVTNHF